MPNKFSIKNKGFSSMVFIILNVARPIISNELCMLCNNSHVSALFHLHYPGAYEESRAAASPLYKWTT